MKLRVGDRVETIDEAIRGKIRAITGSEALVTLDEGFEMHFALSDLIKIPESWLTEVSHNDIESKLKDERVSKKKKPAPRKKKEKEIPPMEVDLHIHKLVVSTRGMTNHEMLTLQLDTAKRQLEFAIKKRIPKIVFIHGVGEGILKAELEFLFGRYPVSFYDANYQKYGLGATEVYIYQNP